MASARSLTARATKVLILSPTSSAAFATRSWVGPSREPATRCGKPFRGLRRLLRSPFSGMKTFYPCTEGSIDPGNGAPRQYRAKWAAQCPACKRDNHDPALTMEFSISSWGCGRTERTVPKMKLLFSFYLDADSKPYWIAALKATGENTSMFTAKSLLERAQRILRNS